MDIGDDWFSILRIRETRILFDLHDMSGPGGWNDPGKYIIIRTTGTPQHIILFKFFVPCRQF